MKPHQLDNMQRWQLHGCFGSIKFAQGALGWLQQGSFVSAETREIAVDCWNNLALLGKSIAEDIKNKTWKTNSLPEPTSGPQNFDDIPR